MDTPVRELTPEEKKVAELEKHIDKLKGEIINLKMEYKEKSKRVMETKFKIVSPEVKITKILVALRESKSHKVSKTELWNRIYKILGEGMN